MANAPSHGLGIAIAKRHSQCSKITPQLFLYDEINLGLVGVESVSKLKIRNSD